MKARNFDI